MSTREKRIERLEDAGAARNPNWEYAYWPEPGETMEEAFVRWQIRNPGVEYCVALPPTQPIGIATPVAPNSRRV